MVWQAMKTEAVCRFVEYHLVYLPELLTIVFCFVRFCVCLRVVCSVLVECVGAQSQMKLGKRPYQTKLGRI